MHEYYNDELQHYGVIGMKWGVRRGDRSKAFAKSAKKADRLKKKSAKLMRKSEKSYAKSTRWVFTDLGKFRNENMRNKSIRQSLKSKQYDKRAEKWVSAMEKEFSNVKVSEISERHLEIGREYVDILNR